MRCVMRAAQGDAVSAAAWLRAHGHAGCVHVSAAVRDRISILQQQQQQQQSAPGSPSGGGGGGAGAGGGVGASTRPGGGLWGPASAGGEFEFVSTVTRGVPLGPSGLSRTYWLKVGARWRLRQGATTALTSLCAAVLGH